MTTLIDEMDNSVARAYDAAPDRLYVIEPGGRIAYPGAPGPKGFDPLAMERALAELLGD